MSNHLQELRKKAGFKSAEEASKALNCSTATVRSIEHGLRKPSPKLASKIVEVYKCSMDDIFLPFYIT